MTGSENRQQLGGEGPECDAKKLGLEHRSQVNWISDIWLKWRFRPAGLGWGLRGARESAF